MNSLNQLINQLRTSLNQLKQATVLPNIPNQQMLFVFVRVGCFRCVTGAKLCRTVALQEQGCSFFSVFGESLITGMFHYRFISLFLSCITPAHTVNGFQKKKKLRLFMEWCVKPVTSGNKTLFAFNWNLVKYLYPLLDSFNHRYTTVLAQRFGVSEILACFSKISLLLAKAACSMIFFFFFYILL